MYTASSFGLSGSLKLMKWNPPLGLEGRLLIKFSRPFGNTSSPAIMKKSPVLWLKNGKAEWFLPLRSGYDPSFTGFEGLPLPAFIKSGLNLTSERSFSLNLSPPTSTATTPSLQLEE